MSAFRLAQVSDMHLSGERPFFIYNWRAAAERVNALRPDLVIATGDLTLNGAEDFEYARRALRDIEAPLRVLPGNRDVGNNLPNRRDDYSVSEEYCKTYRQHFGEDYWAVDQDAWRFIGINALVLGSGLETERRQMQWLEASLADAGKRSIAIFLHKPLYLRTPAEKKLTQASLMPKARTRLLKLVQQHRVRLVASGHLHEYKLRRHETARLVWAPATAYVVNDPKGRGYGGRARVGFLLYEFEGKRVRCRLEEPAEMINHDLSNWFRDGLAAYRRNLHGPYRGLP